jgi:beta-galactosidase
MKPGNVFLILLTLASAAVLNAQSVSDVYNGHRGVNFDSGWKFNLGDVSGAQSADFSDASWRVLNLPHDWSIELPYDQNSPGTVGGGYLDGGIGWYRKSFTLPQDFAGKRVFIEFDGVYMNSSVYINGTLLGTRPYGYSTFEYELTPYLTTDGSANVIAVSVDNNQPTSRWYSGSGIYRNVWLTALNQIHFVNCGVAVSTPSVAGGSATVAVNAQVENQSAAAAAVSVITTVTDALGKVVTIGTTVGQTIKTDSAVTFSQNLALYNPVLWSVASPYRYTVTSVILSGGALVDTFRAPLGIRTTRFDPNTGFYLNGQSLKICGIAMHQDFGAMGTAINRSITVRQLSLLKSMGCNAIRTSHNPPAPEFVDLCDSMGVMVMEEAFDCWDSGKNANDYHLYFNQWGETDLRDMVRRDRNHPSVIMWSIGNEIPDATVATAQNLRTWVRLEDTTRPVTWANNLIGSTIFNQVANVLDLAGYNYGTWQYTADHAAYPKRVIFGSETVAARRSREVFVFPDSTIFGNFIPDVGSGYDNSDNDFSPITAAQDWAAHSSRAYAAGEFIWTGFDYMGECSWPSISHNTGMFDRCGFPKDIYYFYKSQWTAAPMVHILPHWNWNAGDWYDTAAAPENDATVPLDSAVIGGAFKVPVRVYTNCDSVELFLNGLSLGVQRFQADGSLHLAWTVPFIPGTLIAVGKRGGVVAASDTVRTAAAPATVALSVDRASLTADGEGLAFVTAAITDSNGVPNPRADDTVGFTITGPGAIVGVDNGNSLDHSAYKATVRQAYNGKCLAIVRVGTAAGQITVAASSGGLTSGTVGITALPPTSVLPRSPAPAKLLAAPRTMTTLVTGDRFTLPGGTAFPAQVTVYDVAGRLLWSGVVKTGTVGMSRNVRRSDAVYIVKIRQNYVKAMPQ